MRKIFIDWISGQTFDDSGARIDAGTPLQTYLDNTEELELHYVANNEDSDNPADWPPYAGFSGVPVASLLAIDDNFVTELRGTTIDELTAEQTVSEVKVKLAQSADDRVIPSKGFLIVYNASTGTEQGFEYNRRTFAAGSSGTIQATFTLAAPVVMPETFPSGSVVSVPESLMALAEGNYDPETNPVNWVDDSRKDEGIFLIHIKIISPKIIDRFEFLDKSNFSATAEHAIISNGETIRRVQFDLRIVKPLSWRRTAEIPDVDLTGVATKAWVLSLIGKDYAPGQKAFTSADVQNGKLTIAGVKCVPVSLSDAAGNIYPLQPNTARLNEAGVIIDIQANVAAIGAAVAGTWHVNFAGSLNGGGGGEVPPELVQQVETNKTNIETLKNDKVDKSPGKSLIEDSEIARLKDVKNYDDTQVKQDIDTLQADKADNALAPTPIEGNAGVIQPSKFYTWTAAGACTITFEGWNPSNLESSYLSIDLQPDAVLTLPPEADLKGDKLEAGAVYQVMISHNASGYMVVAIKETAAA